MAEFGAHRIAIHRPTRDQCRRIGQSFSGIELAISSALRLLGRAELQLRRLPRSSI